MADTKDTQTIPAAEPAPATAGAAKPEGTAKSADRGADKAAKPPRVPGSAGRSPWLPALALLVVLLALAAVAAGYYLWTQQQALAARQSQLASQQALAEQAGQSEAALGTLRRRLDEIAEAQSGGSGQVGELKQGLEQLRQSLSGIEQRIGRLDAITDAGRAELLRAEAAYLAQVAQYRVRFFADPDTALAALREAERVLAQLGGEAVRERQALHRAIDALVAVSQPDINLLAAEIEALIVKVDVLPLDLEVARQEPGAEQSEPAADGSWGARMARAWDRLKDSLGALVVVQRREQQIEPLLAPEERQFLRHNLRLRLESARLALLMGDEALYRRSLNRVGEWIQRYFAQGEPAVEETLAKLTELRQRRISVEMPDLAPILAPVTRP